MSTELRKLSSLGWKLPDMDIDGIYTPKIIDEKLISYPSQNYSGEETNLEAAGFWAAERARAIANLLADSGISEMWEIGAGNGNAAIPLRGYGIEVIGIEPLRSGALTLQKNGFMTFNATLESLHLPSSSLATIGAFDVLEHLENPELLLSEIYRVLIPGGIFVCSVPAYQWLFSDFDISIGHFRRYSRRSIRKLLRSSTFQPIEVVSRFGFLVFPALILRRIPFLMGRRRSFGTLNSSNNPDSYFKGPILRLMSFLVKMEDKFKFKFGLSIFVLAKKPQKN